MSLLLAALIAVQTPPTVTFTHQCDNASVVLKALGEEIGVEMTARGSVLDDYFLLRLNDVPVQEALDKIAEKLNATWMSDNGVRILTRTSGNNRTARESLLKRYEQILAEKREEYPVPAQLTDDEVRRYFADAASFGGDYKDLPPAHSPNARLAAQILHALKPEHVADIPFGRQVQMAVGPKQWQVALPREAAKYISEAKKDHARFLQIAEGFPTDDYQIQGNIRQILSRNKKLDDFIVLASRDEISTRFIVMFLMEGELDSGRGSMFSSGTISGQSSFKWPETDSQVDWTSEEQAIIDFAEQSKKQFAKSYVRPPQVVIDYATSIAETEILAGIPSKPALQILEEMDFNAVITLSDRMFRGFDRLQGANLKKAAAYTMSGQLRSKDGWVWREPFQSKKYRDTRMDRKATAKYLKAIFKEERNTLENETDYLGKVEQLPRENILIAFVLPSVWQLNGANSAGDTNALMAYGSLSANIKAQARNGGVTVSLQNLKKDVRDKILQVMRTSRGPMYSSRPGDLPWRGHRLQPPGPLSPVTNIGTAFPDQARVRFVAERRKLLFPGAAPGYQSPANYPLMGAADAAKMLASQEKRGEYYGQSDFSKLLDATMARVVMEIEIPGLGYYQIQGFVNETPFLSKPVPWQQLPTAVKKNFEKELAAAREKDNNGRSG